MQANPTFTNQPHSSRTSRYSLVNTSAVIQAIQAQGFKMVDFQKRAVKDRSREGFQKHMAIFEPTVLNALPAAPEGHKWQIIMNNSHDGTCSFQLFGGCFRFACENGLILGEFATTIKIRHVGDISTKVRDGLKEVYATFEAQKDVVEKMRNFTPDAAQIAQIAADIAKERITKRPESYAHKLTLSTVVAPRRVEDMGTDLWTMFNRIQENIIRGGVKYSYSMNEAATPVSPVRVKRHNRTTKEIKSFTEQQALNRMVFEKCFAALPQGAAA